jgi:hypothetical protein
MRNVMIAIIRSIPTRDEKGQVIGSQQIETTKSLPETATLEEVAALAFKHGSNKASIMFETPDAPTPVELPKKTSKKETPKKVN